MNLSQLDAIDPKFHPYRHPQSVGWKGWIEDLGETVAFVDFDGRIVPAPPTGFVGDDLYGYTGDSYPNLPEEDDPADWWKN